VAQASSRARSAALRTPSSLRQKWAPEARMRHHQRLEKHLGVACRSRPLSSSLADAHEFRRRV
jgi:hypothetical protein